MVQKAVEVGLGPTIDENQRLRTKFRTSVTPVLGFSSYFCDEK